ncbi:MAG: hypothetical protein ACOYMG_05170 [Candidatus Methylumidiphilus sp.]
MKSKYLFTESQIELFKRQAHVIRDGLRLYKKEQTPTVTKTQDIWAKCLGYPNYQIFIRNSRGHKNTLEEPVVLTDDSFIDLADTLFAHIGEHFSIDKCRWAIAGLFNMDGKNPISKEDSETIQDAWIKLTPVDERKKRLIDLGLLIVDTKTFENAPELGTIVVDSKSTTLGKYVAGMALEIHEAHPLGDIDLMRLGLSSNEPCRLRRISTSVSLAWKTGTPVSS